jgi:hypothetical protein
MGNLSFLGSLALIEACLRAGVDAQPASLGLSTKDVAC